MRSPRPAGLRRPIGLSLRVAVACLAAFFVVTCVGLNIAERSANSLIGVDRPVASAGVTRTANHACRAFFLGASYTFDLDEGARWAGRAVSALSREALLRLKGLRSRCGLP